MVSVIAWVQFNPRCPSTRKRTIKTEELFVSKMSPSESCTFAEGTQRQEDGDLRDDKHELTFLAWTEVNMQTPECTPGGSQCQSGVTSPFALEVFFELYLLPTFVYRKIAYSDHSLPISAF